MAGMPKAVHARQFQGLVLIPKAAISVFLAVIIWTLLSIRCDICYTLAAIGCSALLGHNVEHDGARSVFGQHNWGQHGSCWYFRKALTLSTRCLLQSTCIMFGMSAVPAM